MHDLETLYHVNLDAASEAARVEKKPLVATTEDCTEGHREMFWSHVPGFEEAPDGYKPAVMVHSGAIVLATPISGVGYAFVRAPSIGHWWLIAERAG
jgi:hypothetical protein